MNSAIDAVNPCNALRPAIGPISPAAKKPASGIPPSKFLDRRRVVVGDPEHPSPTPVAGEQQCADRTPGQLRSRPLHGQAQVLVGSCRVTDLELHRRADFDSLADFDRPASIGRRRAARGS